MEIPSEMRIFLEGLLTDAGMTTLDDGMKEEMVKELYARLDNFITATIVDKLPPEHLETFIKMNEDRKPKAEVEQFLKDHLLNSQEVFTRAFTEFRQMYLGNVVVARNAPAESLPQPDIAGQVN